MRVALRMMGDRNSAEDVVQDVCLRALAQPNGFDGRSRLSTWLHRITVNRSLDLLRKRQRENKQQADFSGELGGLLADGIMPPDEAAQFDELRQITQLLIDRLPDDCRRCFVLTQIDGYTYDEAAEIEAVPRGTVATRVGRAQRILLKHLSRIVDE